MISRVDERLLREAREFSLRFTCDDCAHFDEDSLACEHGYPTEPHRVKLDVVSELLFCKDYELG